MSTTTPTLSLTLYDSTTDQVVTFATFRAVWGGTATTSNFYRIDTWAGTVNSSISNLQNQRGAIPVAASYISANYYEATVASITTYTTGMTILLKLDTDSAGTVTLNISSLGTKSVTKVNSSGTIVNMAGGELQSGRYYLFNYDGTQWVWVDANSSDQIYIVGGTSGNVLTVAADNSVDGTLTQSLLVSQTINSATAKTSIVDGDTLGLLDSAASYVLKKLTILTLKLFIFAGIKPANGTVWNGTISPTVSSNNLTLALKTLGGSDPSSSDPVYVTIGNVVRSVTSALSVTAPAGTQWFGLGTPFAALEQQLFSYLGYNSTDGVVLGFSRIPFSTLYSDFSAVSTNEKYCKISTITNAVSSDNYVNIGRFAATLSAAASYNWSVPTFTSSNLIQGSVYETDWMYWLPAPTGYSSVPTNTIYLYKISGKDVLIRYREQGNGTSNSTAMTQTAPFTAQTITNGFWYGFVVGIDNSAQIDSAYMSIVSGSATINSYKNATDTWTSSGGKRIAIGQLTYPISI